MRRSALVWGLAIGLLVHRSTFAQTKGTDLTTGPEAALLYAKKAARITCCQGLTHPVDFTTTDNIIPMTTDLWTPEQIVEDFQKNHTSEQIAPVVLLKTEFCLDGSRLCTVTTAVFEKKASPKINLFRVYGAWVYRDTEWTSSADGQISRKFYRENIDKTQWDDDLINTYSFKQGPGALIVFLNPNDGMEIDRTTALELEFTMKEFKKRDGTVPKLDEIIDKVLGKISDQVREKLNDTH